MSGSDTRAWPSTSCLIIHHGGSNPWASVAASPIETEGHPCFCFPGLFRKGRVGSGVHIYCSLEALLGFYELMSPAHKDHSRERHEGRRSGYVREQICSSAQELTWSVALGHSTHPELQILTKRINMGGGGEQVEERRSPKRCCYTFQKGKSSKSSGKEWGGRTGGGEHGGPSSRCSLRIRLT